MIQASIPNHLTNSLIFVTIQINLKRVPSTLLLPLHDDLVTVLRDFEVLAHSDKLLVGSLYFIQINKTLVDFASTVDHLVDLAEIVMPLTI